ncbi:polyphosphate kinase [Paenibacillus sp. W2I17]|nr:polyphosphate kinase [Paenibacillus sp. W2I17]
MFYFENSGNPDVFISSADWMTRNLNRRIELMCPVFDPELKKMLVDILNLSLMDNVKARQLMPGGNYVFVENEKPPLRSQTEAMGIIPWKPAEWSALT